MSDQTVWATCSLCGCVGIHACPGHPVKWTPEEKQKLRDALQRLTDREANQEKEHEAE